MLSRYGYGFNFGYSVMVLGGIFLILASVGEAKTSEVMYLQALKGALKVEPKANGKELLKLKRGAKLQVVAKKGYWVQAEYGKHRGWISRLFLSKHKPVGTVDLAKTVPTSLEKASRRRSSSYNVSASTRGLRAGERARKGREQYRSDFSALEKLEKMNLSDEQIEKFWSSAELTVQ